MVEQKFNGVIYLSKAQYDELIVNGKVTINNEEIIYDKYGTIYITPDNDKVTQTELTESNTNLQTQIDEIKTNKKYMHSIKIAVGAQLGFINFISSRSISYTGFDLVTDLYTEYGTNSFIASGVLSNGTANGVAKYPIEYGYINNDALVLVGVTNRETSSQVLTIDGTDIRIVNGIG